MTIRHMGAKKLDKQTKFNLLQLNSFYLFSFFAIGSMTPLLSIYLSEVEQMNGYQIGMITSIGPIIMMFFQPIWGVISDWTGKPAKVLTLTTFAAAFLGLGYLIAHEYYILVAVSIVLAIFQSAIIPVSDSISLQYTTRVRANYGKIRMYGSLGFGIAVLIMGWLSETKLGLDVIFYAFFLSLLLAACLAIRLPEEPVKKKPAITEGMKELFTVKRFLVFLAVTFLIFGPNLANNVYYGLFIEGSGGTYSGIGIAFLLAVLSEVPFMRIASQWIYKLGLLPIMLLAAIASTLRWVFYFTEPALTIVYATSVVQGFSIGLFIPAALQYIRKIVPVHITVTAITVYSAVGNGLGNWFFTFSGGILLEQSNIFSVYLFFALLSFIGIGLILWLMSAENKAKTV